MNFKQYQYVFESKALEMPYGRKLYSKFIDKGLHPSILNGKIIDNQNMDELQKYKAGKRTLIIGVRNVSKYASCRPSADYQLPIFSGCPGMCEYCYLMTRTGTIPKMKVNTNLEQVYQIVDELINEKDKGNNFFELSASSDPIPFEPILGIVAELIRHFGSLEKGRLRICTKFDAVDSLLTLEHEGHTDIRFSINSESVISNYEHNTPKLDDRLRAAQKMLHAGYQVGVMIAPVFIYEGWQNEYRELLLKIQNNFKAKPITIEIVAHRFTSRAKESIEQLFPNSKLNMDTQTRQFKFGQFGYGKYVYDQDAYDEIKRFFTQSIAELLPEAKLLYIV